MSLARHESMTEARSGTRRTSWSGRTSEHSTHEEEHESGSTELSPIFEDRQGDKSFLVDESFPCEKDGNEDSAEDKEEDDSPVCSISTVPCRGLREQGS